MNNFNLRKYLAEGKLLKEDMNDPVLVKARAAKMAAEKEKAKQDDLDKKYGKSFMDKLEAEIILKQQLGDLKSEREQIMIDMEQEAEPEGGKIADEYGSRLNDIDSRMKLIQKDINDLRMYESVNEADLTSLLKEVKGVDTVSTKHLDAIIYEDGGVKLRINSSNKSPYGYTKRDLIKSPFGVPDEEFTFDYIKNEIDEVYTKFPDEEIKELLDKVDQYKNSLNEEDRATRVDKMLSGEYEDEDYKDSKRYDDIRDEIDDEDIVIYDGEEHIIMSRDGNMIYIRPLEDSAILGKRDVIKVPARALAYKSDLDKMYDEYKPKDEINEEFSSTEQKMINQIKSYKKRGSAMVNLPSKVRDFYFKNKEKIDALNELELDVTDSGNPETTGDEAIERESASPAFESKLTAIYKSIKK